MTKKKTLKSGGDDLYVNLSKLGKVAYGRWLCALLCLLLLAGIAVIGNVTWKGFRLHKNLQNWPGVPATVLKAAVAKAGTPKTPLYEVRLNYEYQSGGRTYQSSCYQFDYTGEGSKGGAEKIASGFPAGKRIICYVEPGNPANAVVNRNLPDTLIYAAFVFVILSLGSIFLLRDLVKRQMFSCRSASLLKQISGKFRLNREQNPVKAFMTSVAQIILSALMILFFLYLFDRESKPVLWGVSLTAAFLLMGYCCYRACSELKIVLAGQSCLWLEKPVVRPGEEVSLHWQIPLAWRKEKLTIVLYLAENITYVVSARSTSTGSLMLFRDILYHGDCPETLSGTIQFTVPAGLMHSFAFQENDRLNWKIAIFTYDNQASRDGGIFLLPVEPACGEGKHA